MDLVLIGIGGAFGSLVRFRLGKVISQKQNAIYPIGTFLINISGAILLGIVTGMHAGHHIYLLLADGFLGAYTTFSTFMYEGFNLFHENKKKNAAAYIICSLILGVIGYFIGFELSAAWFR